MKNKTLKAILDNKNFTLFAVWIAMMLIFQLINENYLSLRNIKNIFVSAFAMGILAIGMACLLISGQIDLSAGAVGMMAGVLIALLLQAGIPWGMAFIITILFGVVVGLINAFFINVMHFASFISTLGVSTIVSGLANIITRGQDIAINNKSFWTVGSIDVFGVFPLPFFVAAIFMVVYGVLLSSTRFGRQIYMIGGNDNAARLAGIKPQKITAMLFVNNSVLACLAGVLMASRMHMGSVKAIMGLDLEAITVAVLGGVSFVGGVGNMSGVFVGLLLLNSFKNGLVVVGLDSYYQIVANGILLIGALVLDFFRERSRIRSLKAGM